MGAARGPGEIEMRRLGIAVVFVLLVFGGSVTAQQVIKFMSVRVMGTRAVFDMSGKSTQVQAHYILDEAQDGTLHCTRILFHPNGYHTSQEMPVAFCN
jgi:hypothetical protein